MDELGRQIQLGHGVLSRTQLNRIGVSNPSSVGLRSLRRGWYRSESADPGAVAAVLAGGCLTCVSALSFYGIWIPEGHRRPHVRRNERGRARPAGDVHLCPVGRHAVTRSVDNLSTALKCAASCLSNEDFLVVCDSLLHKKLVRPDQLASWLPRLPRGKELTRCDSRSESGTETMVRLRLAAHNVKLRIQVYIPDIGRVDLLIGDRLILEVDSKSHHTGEAGYARDRRRDRKALRRGLLPLRLTYYDVVHDWDECYTDISALIRRGDHRSAKRPS
jgi:very-short-patch-repair endonuclease